MAYQHQVLLKPHDIAVLTRAQAAAEAAQAAINKIVDSDPEDVFNTANDISSHTDQDNLDSVDSLPGNPIQYKPINEENSDNNDKELPLQEAINKAYKNDTFVNKILAALRSKITHLKKITLSLCEMRDNKLYHQG